MFHPISLYIGLRYTRAKRRNHFISFISATSIFGVALGVTALVTVLSVLNGFEKELRNKILGVSAHTTLLSSYAPLENWGDLAQRLARLPHVEGVAPFIRSAAMATHHGLVNGTVVFGIDPDREGEVTILGEHMLDGHTLAELNGGAGRIVLGKALAEKLKVNVGDRVTLVAPHPASEPGGLMPELHRYTVTGLFDVGMHEYDSALALVNLQDAQQLFKLGATVSGIRLKFDDAYQSRLYAEQIVRDLGGEYISIDWTQFHVNFFKALKSQKAMLFVIVTMIVAVAAFNIVSTLVMVVTDKRSDIAILRTLGLTPRSVMSVFMVQGVLIGIIGTLGGAVSGIWLSTHIKDIVGWVEKNTGFDLLPEDVYVLSDLSYDVSAADVMVICATAFLLSLLATLYPAWRAARTQPAEALRYE